jgi:TldD protein
MTTTIASLAAAVQDEQRRMLSAGCCFADARLYDDDSTESLTYYDGNLESNAAQGERGIGVRVLYNGAWGFAATADLSAVPACFDKALSNARAAAQLPGFPRDCGAAQPVTGSYRSPVVRDPFEVPLKDKLALLRDIDAALQAPHVAHRSVSTLFQRRRVYYWNTDGASIDRWQLNIFGWLRAMAPDADGRQQRRSYELCSDGTGTRGYEWLADHAQFAGHAHRVKAELELLLKAETMPSGRRDVILLPGQGFLQVHETIGHALELDRILGYELSFAGGSHVFS